MAEGWIKLHRSIQEHWLWSGEPFDKRSAWIDLLLLANYEDKKAPHGGKVIICKRGTVNLSIKYLATRWGWSRKKVSNFLKVLESDKMVATKCTPQGTTITIENYSTFQNLGTPSGTSKGTTKEHPRNTTKKDKEIKEDNNCIKPNKNQFCIFQKQDYKNIDFDKFISN